MPKILLIEDEAAIRRVLKKYFLKKIIRMKFLKQKMA